ncbi:MAG: aspartate-alanine antiporter [Prevotellaceae bacterium]|jgi:putative transport protein|nr:aspartate-alanine antiporter [Prevotellaceae bacterium]
MIDWFIKTLQNNPELAIFLALALGFAVGKIKIKGFTLGNVTSVLLMGVLVGQLNIAVSPLVKSVFFLLFLFAVGFSVGPQFVHSLKKEGLPQIAFTLILCTISLGITYVASILAGFDTGNATGLFAGANTNSAIIGIATDTINQLGITPEQKSTAINHITVAFAVTYIFGTAGTAWFLSSIGPKLLGKDVFKQTKEYEAKLGGSIVEEELNTEHAYSGADFRVIKAGGDYFSHPKTIKEIETLLNRTGQPVYIERVRKASGEIIQEPTLDLEIEKGDNLVLNGPIEELIKNGNSIGTEVADVELLDFTAEILKVLVSKKGSGNSLHKLRTCKQRHGVIIRKIQRGNQTMPLLQHLKIQRGDIVELEGRKNDVERFAAHLGYVERATSVTDVLYMSIAIVLGGLFGTLAIHAGSVPLSLSASGGVLIMGILFGWLRSLRPTFGAVPEPSIWLMNNLGLNVFVAVVGLEAGPDFVAGLKASGINLFVAGIFVSIVPVLIGLFMGRYIFKFEPAITLGACAGARTTTASLGSIEEVLQSKVPALSYTTTYAIGNTLLIIYGVVVVLLVQ